MRDARYFNDGYGISGVAGDTIMVGGSTVMVTDVNYSANTITVNKSISWNSGDGVSYAYSGSKPDIGAYEYGSAAAPTADGNVLLAPDFESGTGSWVFYTNGGGTFTTDAAGPDSAHAGRITITAAGTNIQFYQAGLCSSPIPFIH